MQQTWKGEATLDAVRLAQRGDLEAFEVLVERHAADCHRLAAAIVGEAEARDVTQEALLTAWSDLPRLRDTAAFPGWLRRIVVNRCRNVLRGRSRRPTAELTWDVVDVRPDWRDSVHARAVLEPAFERLTDDARAVLALHYAVGLSIREVAETLGIREGTAKSRLNAALTVLRTQLEDPDR